MTFLVSETVHYLVESGDGLSAIESRKLGGGICQPEQTAWRAQPWEREVIQPIPRDQWPIWAKALAQFSNPEDKGIGGIVRRIIGEENSEAFKKWFKSTTGKDCGCTGRQARYNLQYPL